MAIIIKTPEEIEKMRELGRLAAEALDYIGDFVKPGVTTNELNQLVHDYHVNVQGGYPAPLHYGKRGTGPVLQPGMIFTIEPMINQGKRHLRILEDGWTVVTKDRKLSAQWEHEVLVTDTGYEILTISPRTGRP